MNTKQEIESKIWDLCMEVNTLRAENKILKSINARLIKDWDKTDEVEEAEPLDTEAEAQLRRVDCANGKHFWSMNKTGTQRCLFCPARREASAAKL